VVAAVLERDSGELWVRKLSGRSEEVAAFASELAGPVRATTDRVKTDRRDAERMVRLLAAGELHGVAVPSVEAEALCDLVRVRHRQAKLLLRHEIRFDGPQGNWTQAHLSGGWPASNSASRSLSAPSRTTAARSAR
jgi:hypothetical protein